MGLKSTEIHHLKHLQSVIVKTRTCKKSVKYNHYGEIDESRSTSKIEAIYHKHDGQKSCQYVAKKWKYFRVIIQYVLFIAQQNISQGGHEASRDYFDRVSDCNHRNFLKLLHNQYQGIPWLGWMLQSKSFCYAQ